MNKTIDELKKQIRRQIACWKAEKAILNAAMNDALEMDRLMAEAELLTLDRRHLH
jgi:hypothetical protein